MKIFRKLLSTGMLCLCSFIMSFPAAAQSGQKISNDAWRSDLKYFRDLIHAKYSNLFHNITISQFDSAVAVTEKKVGTLNDVQMNVEFAKLVAIFRVGHTMVRQRLGNGDALQPWVQNVPVRFYWFSDGVYIKSIDENYKDAVGGKLVKIGSTPILSVLEKMRPVVAYENEQGFKNMLPFYLNVPEYLQATGVIENTEKVELTYAKDGTEKKITLLPGKLDGNPGHGNNTETTTWVDAFQNTSPTSTPLWMKEPSKLQYFEYLPATKTLYVKHSAVQNSPGESIADFFARVFRFVDSNDVDQFILDIRLNGGGNNYLNKPVITGLIQSRKINRKGHLFVITGKATFSAAQNLTNELEKYTEAVFVGEPTSENVNFFGDTRTETLPNSKLNINLSWLWWQNLDPRDKRKWTAPQLSAEMSFDQYRKGIDPAMLAIQNYKSAAAFDQGLTDLVTKAKFNEALGFARQYANDPLNKYYVGELEKKINDLGYRLMGQNKFTEANKVLQLNIELFPASANAYDSYAESFLNLNKIEDAIKYYNMAVSKDPHGVTGENARAALQKIEQHKKGF